MPREYRFFGTPYDQGALQAAFQGLTNASLESNAQKARSYQALADALAYQAQSILGARERTIERGERRREGEEARGFARAERRAEQEFGATQAEASRRFAEGQSALDRALSERRLAAEIEQNRIGTLTQMAGAAAQQGYPAPELMQILEEEMAGGQAPPGGGAIPPGGPGGFLIGQGGGEPQYQSLQLEGRRPASQRMAGLKPLPQPRTWEEIKYGLDQDQQRRVSATTLELARLRAQGSKDVEVEQETTMAEVLGLGGLDEFELEEAVKKAYPELTPAVSLDGKEGDRRALDAKLKFLTEKRKMRVPNGPGITGLEWGAAGGDPTIIVGALSEAFGEDFAANPDALPMNEQQRQAYAAKKLIEQYPEYVNRFRPASVQLQGDLGRQLGAQAEDSTLSRLMVGPEQPIPWNAKMVESLGLDMNRLPPELQAAAQFGQFTVAPDAEGRMTFQPLQDGTRARPEWQAALDALMQQAPGRVEAGAAAGPEKVTPSQLDKGAAGRRATKPQAKAGAAPQGQPPRRESALEAYAKLRGQPPEKKANPELERKLRVPKQIGLLGNEAIGAESLFWRLLAGGAPAR